jgi:hypothetical protein
MERVECNLEKGLEASMAGCLGKRDKEALCMSPVYSCKKCGSKGCDQMRGVECTAKKFEAGKCLKCGGVGTQLLAR